MHRINPTFGVVICSYDLQTATVFFPLLTLPLSLAWALPLALCVGGLSGKTQSPSLSGPFEDRFVALEVAVVGADGMSLTIVADLWLVIAVASATCVSIGAGVLVMEEARDRESVAPVIGGAETVDM